MKENEGPPTPLPEVKSKENLDSLNESNSKKNNLLTLDENFDPIETENEKN